MPTQAKATKIEELTDKLGRATIAILVQTQGLSVKDMNDLRKKMRAANIEFQIAKNTLLRIASERNNMVNVDKNIFNGQTAVALSYDDEVAAAKAVANYVSTSKVVVLKSAILGGRSLSAQEVGNQQNQRWEKPAEGRDCGYPPGTTLTDLWFTFSTITRSGVHFPGSCRPITERSIRTVNIPKEEPLSWL